MRYVFRCVEARARAAQHLFPPRLGAARPPERGRGAHRGGAARRRFSAPDAARRRLVERSRLQRARFPARFLSEISRLRQILSSARARALSQSHRAGKIMLGIVVALPWELKSLTREKIAPGSAQLIAPGTLIAVSGMGGESARAAFALLIAQGATALMSWGYAAALDERLSAGCLVLPERVIGAGGESYPRSEVRRVGKECRSRWSSSS